MRIRLEIENVASGCVFFLLCCTFSPIHRFALLLTQSSLNIFLWWARKLRESNLFMIKGKELHIDHSVLTALLRLQCNIHAEINKNLSPHSTPALFPHLWLLLPLPPLYLFPFLSFSDSLALKIKPSLNMTAQITRTSTRQAWILFCFLAQFPLVMWIFWGLLLLILFS